VSEDDNNIVTTTRYQQNSTNQQPTNQPTNQPTDQPTNLVRCYVTVMLFVLNGGGWLCCSYVYATSQLQIIVVSIFKIFGGLERHSARRPYIHRSVRRVRAHQQAIICEALFVLLGFSYHQHIRLFVKPSLIG
jgi:hypothetical protein